MTLYLKYFPHQPHKNKQNIKYALDCFEKFHTWSGLKINKSKTYVNIFGINTPEPPYIKELHLNYCKDFTLLGIKFDSTLSSMIWNYDEGIRKLETVVNDWKHKYLTIFGKITVVKTFMLSVLSHVATVLPTPGKKYCKKIETIITNFIRGEHTPHTENEAVKLKASIVSQDVIFSPKIHNGLGLQRVATFWSAIKMGWLRRLDHESYWKTLHLEDLKDESLIFNPHNTNETLIKKALKNIKNPTMKQIYISLLKCKENFIKMEPTSSLFLPLFGEARVFKNNIPAYCEWAIGARVIDIITTQLAPNDAHIKNARRQPVFYQLPTIKNQLKPEFIQIYKNADMRQIRETCPFNIYGRIVYKSKKGSAFYYTLLSYKQNRTLLWEKSRLALERDWDKVNINITINIQQYEDIVRSVLKMKHHNYLKQFMIRLFRNNLYFKNVTSKFSDSGLICNSCKESQENRLTSSPVEYMQTS